MSLHSPGFFCKSLTKLEKDSTCTTVPFTDDCPRFHESANAAANRITAIFEHLEIASKEMKKFCRAGLSMAKACSAISEILLESETNDSSYRENEMLDFDSAGLSPKRHDRKNLYDAFSGSTDTLIFSLTKFGNFMNDIAHAQQLCMDGLLQSFVEPLEKFSQTSIAELTSCRKVATNASDSYSNSLKKLLHGQLKIKSFNSEESAESRSMDLAVLHAESERARFMLARTVSQMRESQFLQVADCLLASNGSLESYFRQCADLASSLKPFWMKLQKKQDTVRRAVEKAEAPWLEQGKQLKATLTTDDHGTKKPKIPHWGDNFSGPASVSNATADYGMPKEKIIKQVCWEQARSLRNVYTPRSCSTSRCVKEGYLFKRSSGKVLVSWHRRWFILDGTQLCYLRPNIQNSSRKEDKDTDIEEVEDMVVYGDGQLFSKVLVCDLLFATVREVAGSDPPFCFEIHSANRRSYQLQAEGPYEQSSWIDAIRKCISAQLTSQDQPLSESHNPIEHERRKEAVRKIMSDNPTCSDCGAPSPEWISINLGVVICIDCGGIHRSLGSHITKVRSLTLDALNEMDLCVALRIGNESANSLLEENIQTGWIKPVQKSTREAKESWIQAKYVWKGFLRLNSEKFSSERLTALLSKAAEDDDLFGILEALLHGANVNEQSGQLKWSPLHRAAAAGSVEACSMLLLNGSQLYLEDINHCSALEIATLCGSNAAAGFLSEKMEL